MAFYRCGSSGGTVPLLVDIGECLFYSVTTTSDIEYVTYVSGTKITRNQSTVVGIARTRTNSTQIKLSSTASNTGLRVATIKDHTVTDIQTGYSTSKTFNISGDYDYVIMSVYSGSNPGFTITDL